MSNKKEEKLSESEEAMLTEAFKPIVHNVIDKVYAPLSWCWPITVIMLGARWLLNYVGVYEMSIWTATVFLWAPVAIVIGLTSLFILFFYLISLFGAWHIFVQRIVFYFKLGFMNGGNYNDSNDDSDDNSEDELDNDSELEDPTDEDEDDEAL